MDTSYIFKTPKGRFIINDERSSIGYSYPRIFIENTQANQYTNIDVTLGCAFKQSKEDFESWIDGTEVYGANFEDICKELHLDAANVKELIDEVQAVSPEATND